MIWVIKMPEIWKYTLEHAITEFRIPEAHTFLHVGLQNGKICVWAKVDPTRLWAFGKFWLVGTGQHKPSAFFEARTYLGTVIIDGQGLVWHVYVEDVVA